MRKIVWLFSGQGSQYYNMGRGLYESDPVFRDTMDRCEEAQVSQSRESLLRELFRTDAGDRFADFTELRHTHPALFAVQYSLAQSLLRRGMKPDLLLGYSLGEVVAAAVGGALSLEEALASLAAQARLFTAMPGTGAMLAVLDSPTIWDPRDPLYADTWVAARNAPQHFVLSGPAAAVDRIQKHLREREILHHRLPVTIAFHCPLIEPVERAFREHLETLKLRELTCPLVSAAYVTQLTQLPPAFFWEVVRRPVRFQDAVAWLEGRGGATYIDLGPFGTLASFLKYGLDRATPSRVLSIMTPFHRADDTARRIEAVMREATQ
jgi:bacillaene synthase trans-acting acyltransferase